jgi:hypothetical protein
VCVCDGLSLFVLIEGGSVHCIKSLLTLY